MFPAFNIQKWIDFDISHYKSWVSLSQLLEYEMSMRTTAFLPFIPCEK
jgi:hypothetical protein